MVAVETRLRAMMFLQFFIWGGWFVTLGSHLGGRLGASGAQIGLAYATQSWGAIIAPLVVGLLADRYVHAQRLLATLHLAGGVLLFLLFRADSFAGFYPLVFAYMCLYMPTLGLVNAIALRQLERPAALFASIRLWGTIGWIVAGLLISYAFGWDSPDSLRAGALRYTFLMCACASVLLGLYAFTLPPTPPAGSHASRQGVRTGLGLDALQLLRQRNFLVFFCASILICIPLAFYYQNTNQFLTEIRVPNATGKQTLGQASEVLCMLLIPMCLHRWGIKYTLLAGMAAWAVRYVLFAFGNAGPLAFLLIIGIGLHGVCYDFFFVSGQIYTDAQVDGAHRSAAQGLITLATYGIGMLIGFAVAGWIDDRYAIATGHAWRDIWLFPAMFAAMVMLVFLFLFRNVTLATAGGARASRTIT